MFHAFSVMFHEGVKQFLNKQPYFLEIQKQLIHLEHWYDEQIASIQTALGGRGGILRVADRKYWQNSGIPVAKLFVDNPTLSEIDDKEYTTYIDRFLCHAGYQYFDTLSAGIIFDKTRYIPRWKVWISAR